MKYPKLRNAAPHTPIRSASSRSDGWPYSASSSSASSYGTPILCQTPPKRWRPSMSWFQPSQTPQTPHHVRQHKLLQYLSLALIFTAFLLLALTFHPEKRPARPDIHELDTFQPTTANISWDKKHDPVRWLKENSKNKYAVSRNLIPPLPSLRGSRRPRAALISLVRNSELPGMMQSMRQLEYRWNRKYKYPWIFFNDEPFTEEFKRGTQNSTSAKCYYALIPKEHWSLPDWIDESRFHNSLDYLGKIGVGKGWMVSYHHMCRWNSGFFYKHPFLKHYDWYWRVEPDVHFYCDIDYDIFRFMRDNGLKYGFNMNILDDARSFPSLWERTNAFAAAHPHLVNPESDLSWLLDPGTGGEYNNCQFFSNFEIGSLNFWRGEANEAYFNWLDRAGGFFYERFGDAPVHTLSVAMFLKKQEVWFFRDIGYQHNINHHCPPNREGKCACQPTSMDENFYKLVPLESSQKKPKDTCIRQWLGGEWLEKRAGWTAESEKEFGGDGFHGYVLRGDE